MKRFEVGKTYACRSLGDYDCIHAFKILARTSKTITTTAWSAGGDPVRRRIIVWDGTEQFRPFGNYSMCAVISADERSLALAQEVQAADASREAARIIYGRRETGTA